MVNAMAQKVINNRRNNNNDLIMNVLLWLSSGYNNVWIVFFPIKIEEYTLVKTLLN